MTRVLALVLGLSLSLAPGVGALSLFGIDFQGLEIEAGVASVSNAVQDSAPSPIINPIGLSLPLRFLGNFTFRPGVWITFLDYGYENGRAVPLESMFDSVKLLNLQINVPFGYEVDLTNWFKVGGEVGLAIIPKIPVFLNGSNASGFALDVTTWFLQGRQFYPFLDGGATWQFSELFGLHLYAYYFYPLFNFWTPTDFWDQQIFGINAGIRFVF